MSATATALTMSKRCENKECQVRLMCDRVVLRGAVEN